MTSRPLIFDSADAGDPEGETPLIHAWRRVELDPRYSGAWVVTGDINGDGVVEIVSARNVNQGDVHYTSAVAAHGIDGRVLWTWGNPDIGRRGLHHDVACQIHDWDGDGRNEVVVCTDRCLVELDGATGAERRRLPIPDAATDCLAFADLSGRGRASDVLIKTRYTRIWALNERGKLLWTVEKPGGFPTAHQPVPLDIDGDGRDEVMAGYAMLNPDGQVRWALANEGRFSGSGHLDCCRVLRAGETPQDWSLVLSCCGDRRLMAVDGRGGIRWEVAGHHFESIDVGRICPQRSGAQILVDLVPSGAGRQNYALWVLDEEGVLLGQLHADYARFHTLVDWDGDGCDEIVLPHSRGLFDSRGKRIGTFAMEPQEDVYGGQPAEEGEIGNIVLRGDMTGDGIPDVAMTTPWAAYVFRNDRGRQPDKTAALGCGTNFTLY